MEVSWESVPPPLLAIGLSLALRNVLLALGVAVVTAALISADYNLVQGAHTLVFKYAASALSGGSHLGVLAFSLLLGGTIGVMGSSGGHAELAEFATRRATTRIRGQVTTWVLGLVIFFDDYINSLVIGSSMRPVVDKLGISREKLAFLVDSRLRPLLA